MHTYAEIPDTMHTKPFIPFGRHLWKMYQQLGLDYYEEAVAEFSTEFIYDLLKLRLDESIRTAKAVIDGSMKNPDKVLSYLLFPPVLPIRGDLSQGSLKLIYGESCDLTFVVVNDIDQEVIGLLNGHCEDGVPVDWWLVGPEDEILERRHLKLGLKLRQITSKTKGLFKAGAKLIDILKDVRNERSPQWSDSSYIICMVWISGIINLMGEASNYEQFAWIHDGINAKNLGLPDIFFGYLPWPPMLNAYSLAGRNKWTLGLTGITTEHKVYLMALEEDGVKWVIENFPELWENAVAIPRQEGIPYPWQTLERELPNYKKKSTFEREQFDYKFPPGDWITPESLGLTVEETCAGIYLDIDHQTSKNEKATSSHIISKGIGINTEFFK
ncbi:MAG: hypothetical protein ACFFCM_08130 [Promethearchaeota archaeon]